MLSDEELSAATQVCQCANGLEVFIVLSGNYLLLCSFDSIEKSKTFHAKDSLALPTPSSLSL